MNRGMSLSARIRLLWAFLSLLLIIIIGTLGLAFFEDWPLFDSLWVTIISLTTTGYGDIIPKTIEGRAFLLGVLIVGVGMVAYSMGAIINILVESQISRIMERNKMLKTIKQLNNHIIVCGAGRVGSYVAQVLKSEQVPYVLIDVDEELIVHRQEEGHLVMLGDATEDEVLLAAGIQKARGIVCALSEDAYNVFIALSARAAKPDLKIVARAEKPESAEKMRRAGADKVISPAQIGGYQMAMSMLKPATVDLVDTLFTSPNLQLQLEEVVVVENSPIANQEIRQVFNREHKNVIVVSIIRKDQVSLNPRGKDMILAGDTLVIIGNREDLESMETDTFK